VEKALDSTHFLGHPRLHQDKLPSHRCASAWTVFWMLSDFLVLKLHSLTSGVLFSHLWVIIPWTPYTRIGSVWLEPQYILQWRNK
jgi:hypothetical protein